MEHCLYTKAFSLIRFFDVNKRHERRDVPKQIIPHDSDWLVTVADDVAPFVSDFQGELALAKMFVERVPKRFVCFRNVPNLKHRIGSLSRVSPAPNRCHAEAESIPVSRG
jgi:hypothetical protein